MPRRSARRPGVFWSGPVRVLGIAARCGALAAVVTSASGCSAVASLLAPSGGFSVAPELQPAYNLLLSNDTFAAWAGTTISSWASTDRPHLVQIVVGQLATDVRAQYDHVGTITVSPYVANQAPEITAAFIAHEIRHADGVRHDCADGERDRTTAIGAWSVHAAVLDSYGHRREADIIRDMKFCH